MTQLICPACGSNRWGFSKRGYVGITEVRDSIVCLECGSTWVRASYVASKEIEIRELREMLGLVKVAPPPSDKGVR